MNRNSNLFFIPFFIVLIIVTVIVAGCTQYATPKGSADQVTDNNAPTVLHTPQSTTPWCPILEYGHGVMIFKCDETDFATSLSEYIAKNNVTVTAIAGVPDRNSYMRMIGYYVVVK